jgi:ubiquinone biosynthesis protein UbiJ
MTEPSLTERQRETIDKIKRDDPLVVAMARDVKNLRTQISGLNEIGNIALGNSRDSIKRVEEIELQFSDGMTRLYDQLDRLMERVEILEKRMQNMAQWAKTMGKT